MLKNTKYKKNHKNNSKNGFLNRQKHNFSTSKKLRNKLIKMYNGNGNGSLRHSVSILQWNAGNKHWKRKLEIIEALTLEKDPDLLFITEANLMADTTDDEREIPGYRLILPLTLESLKYARIVLLVKIGIEVKVLNQFMAEDLAIIWVKIGQAGRKPLVVGGVYREQHLLQPAAPRGAPNLTAAPSKQLDRWRRIVNSWKAAAKDERCIVTGDMNLDYSNWQNPEQRQARMVELVKTEVEPLGFYQMVTNITRSWPQQEDSLVDHCWSNTENRVISYSNVLMTGSDHNLISVLVRMKDKMNTVQEVQRRLRRSLDTKELIEEMKEVDWKDLLLSKNIDVINGILEEAIRVRLDRQAPVKTIQVRGNFKSWVSLDLKNKMKARDSLREVARISGDAVDWSNYRKIRNEVTKDVKKTKEVHFKYIFEHLTETKDSRKIYGTTKHLLGWQQNSSPTSLLVDGRLLKKPIEMANVLIEHFEQKINNLRSKQWPREDDPLIPLRAALDRWGKTEQIVTFKFKKISLLETSKLVNNLSNSVSFGHDKIDALTIKQILPQIIIPLNHLVNTSLSENRFAMKWKLARLLPLLKDKDSNRLDPAQYRPISLLSTIAKVVERAAQVQLLKHFEDHELLNASSHAYRMGLSTMMTLAQICEKNLQGC